MMPVHSEEPGQQERCGAPQPCSYTTEAVGTVGAHGWADPGAAGHLTLKGAAAFSSWAVALWRRETPGDCQVMCLPLSKSMDFSFFNSAMDDF